MKPHPSLSSLFSFFASMSVGLALFALVAVASVVGSLVPSWGDALYGSWWFATLIGALVFNTGLCTVRQIPRALKGTARVRVLFLVHASVLVLAMGCFWGTFAFRSTTVSVHPGEPFVVGNQTWTVDSIAVVRYPDGSVSDWISSVRTAEGLRSIRVNHPAESGDDKVLQSAYARDFTVMLEADGQTTVFDLPQDTETPLTADGRVGLALSPPREGLIAAAQDGPDERRTVDLLLTSAGRILQQTAVFEGIPLELGDSGLTVTVVSSKPRSTFLIRHTPGLWLVWVGLALMAASITVLMLLPRTPTPSTQEPPHA